MLRSIWEKDRETMPISSCDSASGTSTSKSPAATRSAASERSLKGRIIARMTAKAASRLTAKAAARREKLRISINPIVRSSISYWAEFVENCRLLS